MVQLPLALSCKVGGEVNNSVLFGYSSKGHEGFLETLS